MTNSAGNTKTWKIFSGVIVALIAVGTLLVSSVANLPAESGILANFFIFFLGAVIALQLVPGLILFGAMVKGLLTAIRKEKEQ